MICITRTIFLSSTKLTFLWIEQISDRKISSLIIFSDPFISQPGWQFCSHCSAVMVVVVIDGVVVVVVVEVVTSVVVKDVVGASVVVVVVVPAQDEPEEASSETLIPSL